MQNFLNVLKRLNPFPLIRQRRPLVAVLRLNGPIGVPMSLGRSSIFHASIAKDLEAAFKIRGVKAVALVINSPGGSPVQSNLIYGMIRALSNEHKVPVITFAEDVAASGGYWLACAGDEIYADTNSIIGSIGVISAGFGFTELIEKLGVERRLHSSGEHKGMLDSFLPENSEDVKRLKEIQLSIHESFKSLVRDRRGEKLKSPEPKIFSGEFWTGSQALELGLIDGIGDLRTMMRARFGDKVNLKIVGRQPRRFGLSLRSAIDIRENSELLGDWPERLLTAVEVRALWSRFGL